MNAVGNVPSQYLDCTAKDEAELLFTNARVLQEQLRRKAELKRRSAIWFQDYEFSQQCSENLQEIQRLIQEEHYELSASLSRATLDLSRSGLHYFQTYD